MISPREATAGNTPPTTPRLETPSNYLGRFIEWYRDPNTPLLQKVAVVLSAALALFAIGTISQPAAFIIGTGSLFWGIVEARKSDQKKEAVREQIAFPSVIEALGGEKQFEQFPLLERADLDEKPLDISELSSPIMRIHAGYKHPSMIALKLKDNTDNQVFYVAFSFTKMFSLWQLFCENAHAKEVLGRTVGKDGIFWVLEDHKLASLRQIVVEKNHPRFQLVEES